MRAPLRGFLVFLGLTVIVEILWEASTNTINCWKGTNCNNAELWTTGILLVVGAICIIKYFYWFTVRVGVNNFDKRSVPRHSTLLVKCNSFPCVIPLSVFIRAPLPTRIIDFDVSLLEPRFPYLTRYHYPRAEHNKDIRIQDVKYVRYQSVAEKMIEKSVNEYPGKCCKHIYLKQPYWIILKNPMKLKVLVMVKKPWSGKIGFGASGYGRSQIGHYPICFIQTPISDTPTSPPK